jgi:hypothetical protein
MDYERVLRLNDFQERTRGLLLKVRNSNTSSKLSIAFLCDSQISYTIINDGSQAHVGGYPLFPCFGGVKYEPGCVVDM